MSLFQWDPTKYSISVKSMDDEHQKLITLMNKLYDLNGKKAPKAEIVKALDELGAYTVKHFSDEEAYFSKLPGYSLSEAHKKIHKDLLTKFTDLAGKFKSGSDTTIANDFFSFLKIWLTSHIAGVDKKYGEIAVASKAA